MRYTHAFFCDRASDSRALHFTLRVDNDASVILQNLLRTYLSIDYKVTRTSKYRKTPSRLRHALR